MEMLELLWIQAMVELQVGVFKKNVIAMSFTPRDSHEAQVQLALERGVLAVNTNLRGSLIQHMQAST